MIITLKNTTTSEVAQRIVEMRSDRGSAALGRVLTLIIVVPDLIDVDRAIEISDAVSREHPCRVIVVVDTEQRDTPARLNAQVRIGESAGPSDVVVLEPRGEAASDLDSLVMPLLLSDTPVVTYWPDTPPDNPGEHPLGKIATRRITDSRTTDDAVQALLHLAEVYTAGDTDLSWAGVTLWRALLAAVVEQLDHMPVRVVVRGHATHPSSFLMAAWLGRQLGVETVRETHTEAETITAVSFEFDDGTRVTLSRRADSAVAQLDRPGLETADVNLPTRSVQDCLMEELRRLDPDDYYEQVITEDLPQLVI
ncbi:MULTISPECIES: glucose-6-phosphate dehydrogenase assembly protein OpcA [unclassified Actinobaculum]|uniref:glucose-6-phosphate dehydrogenase assembly protein OpcA n=1 Tax=unclassified Actinobaculum TaxID=2609299 RepID=UPI000D5295C2|nr:MULTISPECIES: glucose-6-phosphate dehydrogenase assembly protein OpcA [unclassified Actinobaculum]AWE41897.1 oxppcycle protein OpcA [Actinobaculum sp. 313]RTE50187.1 oxppcycle protein OpcA [Actinobaculum sp. 352]